MGGASSKRKAKLSSTTKRRQSHCQLTEPQEIRFSRRLSSLEAALGRDEVDAHTTVQQPRSTASGIGSGIMFSSIDEEFEDEEFSYENLVLEGGGSQGGAYIGVIVELERLGLLDRFRRFAGSSAGAITAAYLAVGHRSERFIQMMREGPKFIDLLDAQCGSISLIPNFMRRLGWQSGWMAYRWFGDVIEEQMGDRNATFKDLYDKTGRELCVVVTNLSLMMEEYCHVKTTPNMSIICAVKMSTSAPVMFQPFRRTYMGRTDLYIDGGIVCNYPVHCFDGWWLSMKPEDSFLRRMQPLGDVGKLLTKKERFGGFNEKTLGIIIFSDYDSHVLAVNPELLSVPAPIPNTKLSRAYKKVQTKRELTTRQHELLTDAMTRFMKVLNDKNLDGNDTIHLAEFKEALNGSTEFTHAHARALFGDGLSIDDIFDRLDINHDGQIDFNELMALAEQEGVGIQTHHIGTGRLDIQGPSDFISGLFQTLLTNVKRAFLEGNDVDRTVLINTVYIKSLDVEPEDEDVDFLMEQGRRGIQAFLKYEKRKLLDAK